MMMKNKNVTAPEKSLELSKRQIAMADNRSLITMGIALVVLFTFLSILSPNFCTATNMTNILSQISFIALLALGETFVMLTGGIDLSVGSVLGLSSMAGAVVMTNTGSIPMALVACLVTGLMVGLFNGVLVSVCNIPAFIVTLGVLNICRGANYLISGGRAVSKLGDAYKAVAGSMLFASFRTYYLFIIILFVFAAWILSSTKLGRNIYAIGSNVTATRLAGINTKLYSILPYIISGVLAAIAGFLMGSRYGAVDPNYGTGYEMDALTAVVIGGTAMTGGKGTIAGTAIGVVFMGVMKNGLDVVGVSPYWQTVAVGAVLIIALLVDRFASKKK